MKKIYTILATAILITLFSAQVMGQTTGDFISKATGNWGTNTTWQRYNGTSWVDATSGQTPTSTSNVTIQSSHNVTATASATCARLTFNSTTASPTLTVNTGIVVTVTGTVDVLNNAESSTYALITGLGSINCASINVGGNITKLSADGTTRLDLTVSSISVSGNVNLYSEDDRSDENDCQFRISSGQLSVGGQIITDEEGGEADVTIEMNNGSQNGTLVLTNSTPFLNSVGTLDYSFNGTSNTVNYASTSSQTVATTTYRNLTISGGGAKTASNNVTVNGTLTFTNGILTFTSGQLQVGSTGSVTGASNSSHINGQVRKTGSTLFVFPVGKSGRYAPISVNNISGSVDITAEYFRADPGTAGLPLAGGSSNPGVQSVSRSEYWSLLSSGIATCAVTFSLNAGSLNSSTPNLLRLVRTTNTTTSPTTWTSFVSQANTTSTGTSTSGSITASGVSLSTTAFFTTFGSTTANAFVVLPVSFGAIKAAEKNTGVQIDWTSYSEQNLANYQIERSADGINFTSIGEVAARNVLEATNYNFYDAMPLTGTSFYRIRNNDIDGKSGLSNIVKINLNKNIKTIGVYPNPVIGNRVSFQTSDLTKGTYNVELINAFGARVFQQSVNHAGGAINQSLNLPSLQSGSYTLRINGTVISSTHKLIILQ